MRSTLSLEPASAWRRSSLASLSLFSALNVSNVRMNSSNASLTSRPSAAAFKALRNGRTEFGVDVNIDGALVEGVYNTDLKLFGGTYAVGAPLDYIGADVSVSLNTPRGA